MARVPLKVVLPALALALGLLIALDQPLPQGWKNPVQTKLLLVTWNMMFTRLPPILELFGYDKVDVLRKVMMTSEGSEELDALVRSEDIELNGVKARLYTSAEQAASQTPSPAVIYFHGGGWVLGSIDHFDVVMKRMVRDFNAVLVSVEYPLAPEHPFPAPFDACVTATKSFLKNARHYGVDQTRVGLAGDSAGGNLAAAVSLKLRDDRFSPRPKLQVLFYPVLQALDLRTPSYQASKGDASLMAYFTMLYLKGTPQGDLEMREHKHVPRQALEDIRGTYMPLDVLPKDDLRESYVKMDSVEDSAIWEDLKELMLNPYVSPLFADDLSGLPKTLVNVCQMDMLRDDGVWFAHRLVKEGTEAQLDLRHCFHGWNFFTEDMESAKEIMEGIVAFVKENL